MWYRTLLLVVLLFGFGPDKDSARAQGAEEGMIEGTVIDSATAEPIIGAAVYVGTGRATVGTLTRAGGAFRLERVPVGEATLRVRLIGSREQQRAVSVSAGSTTRIVIALAQTDVRLRPLEVIGESPDVHRRMTGTATRVDARTLAALQPIGTQEVIQQIPGINAAADDGTGSSRISVGIRGLSPRRSSRVLILEDGVPIAPAAYLYPNMYYNPPAERIEAVEVIKGSAAVRYGPQTMGGVINYLTRRPRSAFGGLAQVTAGTNGYVSALAEIGGWGSDVVHPELQLLYKRGDGYRDNNAFAQYNATAKVNVVPDEDRVIYIKANVDREVSEATYTGLTEYSFATDPTFNPKEHDEFTVLRTSLDVLYSHTLAHDLTSTTKLYSNYFDREWWRENDVFVRPTGLSGSEPVAVPYYERGDLVRVGNGRDNFGNLRSFYVIGVEQAYDYGHTLFGSRAELTAGARLHFDRFIDNRVVGSAPDARDGAYYHTDPNDSTAIVIDGIANNYETTALALFATERLTIGNLTLTPGIRVEIFEQQLVDRLRGALYQDKTSHVVLPGLGANLALGDWNVFGGIHRGFTPPSSGTLAAVNFGANAPAGGLDIESEKSWNTELGVRANTELAQLEIAGFHMAIEDLVAAGVGATFKNLARARTFGLELGAHVHLSRAHAALPDVNVAYTLLGTEVVDGRMVSAVTAGRIVIDLAGKELPYAPRHTVIAGLSKDFAFGLSMHADVQYVSRVYTDFENIEVTYNRGDTGPVPAYAVVGASATYTLSPSLSIALSAKNLFDNIYIGSRLHSHPGMPEANQSSGILPGARRQLNMTVRYVIGQ